MTQTGKQKTLARCDSDSKKEQKKTKNSKVMLLVIKSRLL